MGWSLFLAFYHSFANHSEPLKLWQREVATSKESGKENDVSRKEREMQVSEFIGKCFPLEMRYLS